MRAMVEGGIYHVAAKESHGTAPRYQHANMRRAWRLEVSALSNAANVQ
jgi:hypothetical protein